MLFRPAVVVLVFVLTSSYLQAQGLPFNPQQMQSLGSHTGNSSPISGSVRTADDKPLKDVRVELRDAGSGVVVGSVYTNVAGYFEFPQVNRGLYEVVATGAWRRPVSALKSTACQGPSICALQSSRG